MRGAGVLIMLQGHVLDGWVRSQDRLNERFWLSQFLGGLPAPIFLFLVGVSLAIVLDRMRTKGASQREIVARVLHRGSWILLLAYAFRVEQFLVWYPYSRWQDIFKVDTLNCIAISTLAIGLLSVPFRSRGTNATVMAGVTCAFVFFTPWIYPLRGLPRFLLSYFNGANDAASFSFFPWAAFTLAGITAGYLLLEARSSDEEPEFFKRVAVAGVCAYAAGSALSLSRVFEYGFFDYSLTSPHFFLIRLGWLLLILYGAYLWSRRKSAGRWSPLITLGQASLIVYWVHIEIVYGRVSQSFAQSLEISTAAMQLLWLVPMMLFLASFKRIRERVVGGLRLDRKSGLAPTLFTSLE
jgi:uncharacterized membrane protein